MCCARSGVWPEGSLEGLRLHGFALSERTITPLHAVVPRDRSCLPTYLPSFGDTGLVSYPVCLSAVMIREIFAGIEAASTRSF